MRANNRVTSLRVVAVDGGAELSNITTKMRATLLTFNLQILRTANGTGRGGVDTKTDGMANKREDARRTWTRIARMSLNAPGALGEEAINIEGNIRRVAKAAESRLSVRKNIPLPILLGGIDGLPAREADNGTVREVANENAFDV